MAEKSSIFDMIGPLMIVPSSSHTAGAVRIARAAIRILDGPPEETEITFYNSFAITLEYIRQLGRIKHVTYIPNIE